jgi:hypothetical protein
MLEFFAHIATTSSLSSRHWLVIRAQCCQLIDADRFTLQGPMPEARALKIAERHCLQPGNGDDLRRYRETCLFDGVDAYADGSDPSRGVPRGLDRLPRRGALGSSRGLGAHLRLG